MSRFILEGFATEELVGYLHNDAAFPLVRELCHKFGLRVLTYVQQGPGDIRKFQLCLPNGMANHACELSGVGIKESDCLLRRCILNLSVEIPLSLLQVL